MGWIDMDGCRWKRVARLAVIVLGAVFAGWLLGRLVLARTAETVDNSHPKLIVGGRQLDLGVVRQGRVLEARFPISNAGARRLILVEEGRSCCEELAEDRQIVLPPDTATDLTIALDTTTWAGQAEQEVRYTTNDPQLPRFTLTVTARVEPPPEP